MGCPANQNLQQSKPVVAVITMGGTIASSFNPNTNTIIPTLSGYEILQSIPNLTELPRTELHEFCNLPGPHLTPEIAFQLAGKLRHILSRKEVYGAVVIQGTDTLEEIAYLINLTVDTPKPIVFTGAMKSHYEPYVDSTGNILGAIRVAGSSSSYNRGVMVFFNQEIHHAKNVVKFHTNNISAFRSSGVGPMGMVYNDQVVFFYLPTQETRFHVKRIEPKVALIKTTLGMDGTLIKASIISGVAGIVIEGLGAGNLPPQMIPTVRKAIEQKIPVIMVSRCFEGSVIDLYGYEGGGAKLKEIGVIFGGSLSGPKARVKLMVVLGYTSDMVEIGRYFENDEVLLVSL